MGSIYKIYSSSGSVPPIQSKTFTNKRNIKVLVSECMLQGRDSYSAAYCSCKSQLTGRKCSKLGVVPLQIKKMIKRNLKTHNSTRYFAAADATTIEVDHFNQVKSWPANHRLGEPHFFMGNLNEPSQKKIQANVFEHIQ